VTERTAPTEALITKIGPTWRIELPDGAVRFVNDEMTPKQLAELHRLTRDQADAYLALLTHIQRQALSGSIEQPQTTTAEHPGTPGSRRLTLMREQAR
jgi:hypothetical protein